MYRSAIVFAAALPVAASAVVISARAAPRPAAQHQWSAAKAAAYLDQRQGWWESWPKAARDHGTVCVSCHTALPYALVRPVLRATLQETDTTAVERKLVADVVTRVRSWTQVEPFYGSWTPAGREKATESRGTESVLNALILASRDQRAGAVSADARAAFGNMFALQRTSGDSAGAWSWLSFGLRPWESGTSGYFGAALAAIALGMEPHGYAEGTDVKPNVERLRAYLRTYIDQSLWNRLRRHDNPSLFNRAMLLWASGNLPGLISSDERQSIIDAFWRDQESDGSWKLESLGYWRRADGVRPESDGDGYATGLVAYALEQAGVEPNEPHLARALAWLGIHQDTATGMWRAPSLNKSRDPATNVGKFMSDAATAYAALALTGAEANLRGSHLSANNIRTAKTHLSRPARP